MSQRLSDTLTDTLQAIYKTGDTTEATSTEDCISKIEELNAKIRNGQVNSENMMVGSLDVTALYPSINTKHAGRICRDRIKNSPLSIEGTDYKQALRYMKLVMKQGTLWTQVSKEYSPEN